MGPCKNETQIYYGTNVSGSIILCSLLPIVTPKGFFINMFYLRLSHPIVDISCNFI